MKSDLCEILTIEAEGHITAYLDTLISSEGTLEDPLPRLIEEEED